jgi:DNA ligase (NAD+)
MNIQELEQKIREANEAYRTGNKERSETLLTDQEYDTLLEELEVLDPENSLLTQVGLEVDDSDRKEKLPIIMASMNKVKTVEEIEKWFKSKNIPKNTEFILTPKYDGLSLCVEESRNKAWTRGDGKFGQRSDEHLKLISSNRVSSFSNIFTYGEVIMKRETFHEKYSEEFSNPRNLVAGQLNHKTPNQILKDCDYISYGMEGVSFTTKKDQLEFLNSNQKHPVPYKVVTQKYLTTDFLLELFTEWNKEYEIDGIIIEINDMKLREKMGRETSTNNPTWARAYKGNFEEVKEAKVTGITWNISKQGLLKPVIQIETTQLDGVNVSNVTGNNAKFMKEMGIGIGSIIKVKRSGMVIPLVVSIVHSTGFEMPVIPNVDIEWNENGVELVTKSVTEEQRLKQLISFFNILGVDNLGEGNLKQFFEAGYDTPQKVLEMTEQDMIKLEKFGKRKASIVKKSIDEKRKVTLSKLQHASGFFTNLGSKKLLLLEDMNENSTIDQISNIEGFSEISAKSYLNGIKLYNEWVKDFHGLLSVIKTPVKSSESNDLEGMAFVFTGVRRNDLNQVIENRGGRVASSVSGKTTHLVMKKKGSGSSKEKKAIELGQTILEVEELEKLLGL